MEKETYLDITLIRCPKCRKIYSDASWYVLDMEGDIECSICGETFNTRKNIIKRILLRIDISDPDKLKFEYRELEIDS